MNIEQCGSVHTMLAVACRQPRFAWPPEWTGVTDGTYTTMDGEDIDGDALS